jgi:hypothetical protein
MVTIFGVAEGDPETGGFGELPPSNSPTANPVEDLQSIVYTITWIDVI